MKKIQIGDIYNLLGHRYAVKKIEDLEYNNEIKVYLDCSPHCCTTPFVSKIEMLERHLIEAIIDSRY